MSIIAKIRLRLFGLVTVGVVTTVCYGVSKYPEIEANHQRSIQITNN